MSENSRGKRVLFGENLRKIRKSKKLTQEELANVLGKKRNTIASWETGSSHPDPDTQDDIAKYFEINLSTLFGEIDEKSSISSNSKKDLLQLINSIEDEWVGNNQLIRDLRQGVVSLIQELTEEKERVINSNERYIKLIKGLEDVYPNLKGKL